MFPSNRIALKEWAVICDALASGRQQLLFRKGGIREDSEEFEVAHREFWLFPTGFHQTLDAIVPEHRSAASRIVPPSEVGMLPIQYYAVVRHSAWIDDLAALDLLRPFHVLTAEALATRFHYRRPGLFVLVVETWALPAPLSIALKPRYEGCRSWVELSTELSTSGLVPAAGADAWQTAWSAVQAAVSHRSSSN